MTRRKYGDDVLTNDFSPLQHAADGAAQQEGVAAKRKLECLKKLVRTLLVEVGATGFVEAPSVESGFNFYEAVRRFEISLIKQALLRTGGHQRRAARLLGIKPTTLNNKIKFYNIDTRATFDIDNREPDACDAP